MDAQPSATPTGAEPLVAATASGPAAAAAPPRPETIRYMAAFDAPRTFLGPRADYYDENWRWMDWTGRRWSWNSSAALGFVGWLAYRRMYRAAVPALLWLGLAAALIARGAPISLVAVLHAGLALGLGFYGNTLYLRHFRRLARTVREDDHDARLATLARIGGTSRRAAVGVAIMAVALILGVVQLLGAWPPVPD